MSKKIKISSMASNTIKLVNRNYSREDLLAIHSAVLARFTHIYELNEKLAWETKEKDAKLLKSVPIKSVVEKPKKKKLKKGDKRLSPKFLAHLRRIAKMKRRKPKTKKPSKGGS